MWDVLIKPQHPNVRPSSLGDTPILSYQRTLFSQLNCNQKSGDNKVPQSFITSVVQGIEHIIDNINICDTVLIH